ncbi:MAG: hypothetical protein AABY09_04680 [Nanoarchaeota archaeon]
MKKEMVRKHESLVLADEDSFLINQPLLDAGDRSASFLPKSKIIF